MDCFGSLCDLMVWSGLVCFSHFSWFNPWAWASAAAAAGRREGCWDEREPPPADRAAALISQHMHSSLTDQHSHSHMWCMNPEAMHHRKHENTLLAKSTQISAPDANLWPLAKWIEDSGQIYQWLDWETESCFGYDPRQNNLCTYGSLFHYVLQCFVCNEIGYKLMEKASVITIIQCK